MILEMHLQLKNVVEYVKVEASAKHLSIAKIIRNAYSKTMAQDIPLHKINKYQAGLAVLKPMLRYAQEKNALIIEESRTKQEMVIHVKDGIQTPHLMFHYILH